MGLGIVVEYAGKTGAAGVERSHAGRVGLHAVRATAPAAPPDETITLTFDGAREGSQFDTWTINGDSWPESSRSKCARASDTGCVLRNGTGDQHPIHLHRHTFEGQARATSR